VLVTAMVAWMAGSFVGYEIGVRRGRWLLDRNQSRPPLICGVSVLASAL
jgi:membrane protein DedA with SNARE-associated domain